MSNASFFTADRATHLKIVVVSLLAATAVMTVGIMARPNITVDAAQQQANVYKPQKAVVATSEAIQDVR